ncbi:MAG: carboxymuconolactone decarboxylase family protein [Balneolaceae bacterium]
MSRFSTPEIDSVPQESQEMLQQLQDKLGFVPNIYASLGRSPIALKIALQTNEMLQNGEFTKKEIQAIYLATSERNGCTYCASAHTALAKQLGFSEDETLALRGGSSGDAKLQAITQLARSVLDSGGHVPESLIDQFFEAGYSERALTELLALVATKSLSNYAHGVFNFDIDFPKAEQLQENAEIA